MARIFKKCIAWVCALIVGNITMAIDTQEPLYLKWIKKKD